MNRQRFGDRRGVAAVLVALMLVVLLGMAALAVDQGMILAARTEAQRAADAGALAGAVSLKEVPGDEDRARAMAIQYAIMNTVRGSSTDVLVEDVDVELANDLVRVRVIRSFERGSPLQNLFARALGIGTSDISAVAAAHVGTAAGVNCPLPFVVVDRWWETSAGRLAEPGDTYGGSDIYNAGPLESLPGSPNEKTGYGVPDRGRILRIYPGDPGEAPLPGWAFLLELNDDQGGNKAKKWIQGCEDPEAVFKYGDMINIKNGMTVGPVDHGFTEAGTGLINQDPTAFWGTTLDSPNAPPGGCVMRPGDVDGDGNLRCVSSPRIKPAFLIEPGDVPPQSGNADVPLRNFVGLFVICVGQLEPDQKRCTGNIQNPGGGVWVRFVEYTGVNVLPPNQNPGSLVRTIQLVQ